jgi:hypothetical protein
MKLVIPGPIVPNAGFLCHGKHTTKLFSPLLRFGIMVLIWLSDDGPEAITAH